MTATQTPATGPRYEVRTYGYFTCGVWDTGAGRWVGQVNIARAAAAEDAAALNRA